MSQSSDIAAFLSGQLANPETQWSLGTFGAIAEFSRDADEPTRLKGGDALEAVTDRGGIRIAPHRELRAIAFETTTKEGWSQRVALCLPEQHCAMNRRAVLTELGPDTEALREDGRGAALFDMGIDALQVDVCVRMADPQIAAQLRAHCGQPVLAAGNPAMGVILAHSPHRVFISRIGRIEVYQPIPPHDGKSPEGPHTHVLPNLLKHRRTHAATEPIPDGLVPCAHLYPAHPTRDTQGRPIAFRAERHHAFQQLLQRFGHPQYVALKQRVVSAVARGEDPSSVALAHGRFARTNVRVALRQIEAAEPQPPSLAAWLAAYEHSERDQPDEDRHEHR